MQGTLLAAVSPSNTPHGYNLTFAFPMLMFIIIAGALYLRFRSPHRVPGHATMSVSKVAAADSAAAHAAAVAEAGTPVEPAAGAATDTEQAKPADEGREDGG